MNAWVRTGSRSNCCGSGAGPARSPNWFEHRKNLRRALQRAAGCRWRDLRLRASEFRQAIALQLIPAASEYGASYLAMPSGPGTMAAGPAKLRLQPFRECRTPSNVPWRIRCRHGEDRPIGAGNRLDLERPCDMIDDFRLWGSSRCRQMGRPPFRRGGGRSNMADMILLRTTPLSQRAEPLAVVGGDFH